ncbi:MAG: DUF2911 domain-containing protein [Candidatus Didemnitutus sp.]|jgi:hypothetical protein|nr:DUF2911 domain-containing protein [Candidatus Didemnitutus sp.]
MISKLTRSTLVLAVGLAAAAALPAQTAAPQLQFPAASPAASLKQRVGITDIEITYARPSMKGRAIFGALVPYGHIWRTGANSAPKITFSTPVTLGGANLEAGTYELFTIPNQDEWTIIIHKNMSQWGSYSYDAKNDVARVTAKPVTLSAPVESFAIWFNDLRDNSATLNLTWETTSVAVPLTVDTVGMLVPKVEAALANTAAKPNPMMLFSAAMFFLENNHDLPKALELMNAAIAGRPGQMWMVHRKALILERLGDKAGAKAAAEESIALAEAGKDQPAELRDEYIRLNKALLSRVQ